MDKLEIVQEWKTEKINNCITSISLTNKKIKKSDYKESGVIPIIDQGKKFLGGFTDNIGGKISVQKPLIVFGDHTKEIKFIDFDFAPGADGIKVLEFDEKILPKYSYYFLKSIKFRNRGYSRYFTLLKNQHITFPENKTLQKKLL